MNKLNYYVAHRQEVNELLWIERRYRDLSVDHSSPQGQAPWSNRCFRNKLSPMCPVRTRRETPLRTTCTRNCTPVEEAARRRLLALPVNVAHLPQPLPIAPLVAEARPHHPASDVRYEDLERRRADDGPMVAVDVHPKLNRERRDQAVGIGLGPSFAVRRARPMAVSRLGLKLIGEVERRGRIVRNPR